MAYPMGIEPISYELTARCSHQRTKGKIGGPVGSRTRDFPVRGGHFPNYTTGPKLLCFYVVALTAWRSRGKLVRLLTQLCVYGQTHNVIWWT